MRPTTAPRAHSETSMARTSRRTGSPGNGMRPTATTSGLGVDRSAAQAAANEPWIRLTARGISSRFFARLIHAGRRATEVFCGPVSYQGARSRSGAWTKRRIKSRCSRSYAHNQPCRVSTWSHSGIPKYGSVAGTAVPRGSMTARPLHTRDSPQPRQTIRRGLNRIRPPGWHSSGAGMTRAAFAQPGHRTMIELMKSYSVLRGSRNRPENGAMR